MISAKQAYSLATNQSYDKDDVEKKLQDIDEKIKDEAKIYNAISIKYKIENITLNKNIFATYLEVIRRLQKQGYRVNIQTERYDATEVEKKLLELEVINTWRRTEVERMVRDRMNRWGTYLYISWDQQKKV